MNGLLRIFTFFGRLLITFFLFILGLAFAFLANQIFVPLTNVIGFYTMYVVCIADGLVISLPKVKLTKPSTFLIVLFVILMIIVMILLFGSIVAIGTMKDIIELIIVLGPLCIFIFIFIPQFPYVKSLLLKFERNRDYYSLYFLPVNLISILVSILLVYSGKGQEFASLSLNAPFILITVAMLSFMSAGYGILLISFGQEAQRETHIKHYRKLRGTVYEGETYGIFLLLLQIFGITFGLSNTKAVIIIISWIFLDFLIVFVLNAFILTTLLEKGVRAD